MSTKEGEISRRRRRFKGFRDLGITSVFSKANVVFFLVVHTTLVENVTLLLSI